MCRLVNFCLWETKYVFLKMKNIYEMPHCFKNRKFSLIIPKIQYCSQIDHIDYFLLQNPLDNNLFSTPFQNPLDNNLFSMYSITWSRIFSEEISLIHEKTSFFNYRYTADTFIFLIFIYIFFNTGHSRLSLEVRKCYVYLWFHLCKTNLFRLRGWCMT